MRGTPHRHAKHVVERPHQHRTTLTDDENRALRKLAYDLNVTSAEVLRMALRAFAGNRL